MPSQAKGEYAFLCFILLNAFFLLRCRLEFVESFKFSPIFTFIFVNILPKYSPPYRGDVSSGVSDRVLSQLLTELDGVHVSSEHTLSTHAFAVIPEPLLFFFFLNRV